MTAERPTVTVAGSSQAVVRVAGSNASVTVAASSQAVVRVVDNGSARLVKVAVPDRPNLVVRVTESEQPRVVTVSAPETPAVVTVAVRGPQGIQGIQGIQGVQGEPGITPTVEDLFDVSGKVDGSVLYYSALSESWKGDDINTVLSLTDGGNF